MWKKVYQQTFKDVSKNNIWKLWTDINNWPSWHGDLEFCKLEGEFAVGNHFTLKPKGAPAVKIKLIEIEHGKKFTDLTEFLGAKMYDTHEIEETNDGIKLTNTLIVTGPLKWIWIKLVAAHVANTVAIETEMLVKLARKDKS